MDAAPPDSGGACAADGAPCDDGDPCTDGDVCAAGVCAGEPVDCSALDDGCTLGVCDPATGACGTRPIAEGDPCEDGDACTEGEVCTEGTCGGGAPVDCGGLDGPCAAGRCDPTEGCVAEPRNEGMVCDDADDCTTDTTCAAGECLGTAVDCSALDAPCRVGVCTSATGCVAIPMADGTSCDDGDACTTVDRCERGACVGGSPVDCSAASDQCNAGECVPATGTCRAVPLAAGTACDDGDGCTRTDTCRGGVCLGASPVDCSGLDDACNVGTCDPTTGSCGRARRPDGTRCDDGNACTLSDRCAAGACAGTARDCSGATDQCNVGSCDPTTGNCVAVPRADGLACNDGDSCTTPDRCSAGVCTGPNTCCSPRDFRITEVFGGSPDYIEVTNTGSCTQNVNQVAIRFTADCELTPVSYTFPSFNVAPGGTFRVIDSTITMGSNEVYFGSNICHNPTGEAWVALCLGPCTATCSNYIDYVEIQGSSSAPTSPPTCASFTPAPVDGSPSTTTTSVTRTSFAGGGTAGRRSDWSVQPLSRTP